MPAVLGAGTAVALAAGSAQSWVPVLATGLGATVSTAICAWLMLRAYRRQNDLRRRLAELERASRQTLADIQRERDRRVNSLEQQQQESQRLVLAQLGDELLPAALKLLRDGETIDDILPSVTDGTAVPEEFRGELRRVLRTALHSVEEEYDRSTSAEQTVVSIGRRMHVYTSKLRGQLDTLQQEHSRLPAKAIAQALMELDQELGPADCLAASIVVLGGSDRPGKQWREPQPLFRVVRGGMGLIKDFRRVKLRKLPELGVDGRLVDHLTLLLAQILDNATRYSPPTEQVVVSGKEVPNGVGIEIQDSGTGLKGDKKRQALAALAGEAAGPGLGGLAEDAHLGLRVVGALARKYGISVTFDDSAWLGTSVVVLVPHQYFTPLAADPLPEVPATPAAITPPRVPEPNEPDISATTSGGLPKRRRRRETDLTSETTVGTARDSAASSEDSLPGLAAFISGSRPPAVRETDDNTAEPESD